MLWGGQGSRPLNTLEGHLIVIYLSCTFKRFFFPSLSSTCLFLRPSSKVISCRKQPWCPVLPSAVPWPHDIGILSLEWAPFPFPTSAPSLRLSASQQQERPVTALIVSPASRQHLTPWHSGNAFGLKWIVFRFAIWRGQYFLNMENRTFFRNRWEVVHFLLIELTCS